MSKTIPGVFIIESLDPADKKYEYEGVLLSRLLRMNHIRTRYRKVTSFDDLEPKLREFRKIRFRYLHISCHGSRKSLVIGKHVAYEKVGKILGPYLDRRRLFVSACYSGQDALAQCVMNRSSCFSLVGPQNDPYFSDAAIAYLCFYHKAFGKCSDKMKNATISGVLRKINRLYNTQLQFYRRSERSRTGFVKDNTM